MQNTETFIKIFLSEQPDAVYRLNEPMKNHVSFKIGGEAAAMFFPRTADELRKLIEIGRKTGVKPFIMGNGTNLLVSDERLDMIIIKTHDGLGKIKLSEDKEDVIIAESGALLSKIAVFALNNGLTGFEFAHGIPGTFGGALVMNAGAYGGEMKDVVLSAEYISESGDVKRLSGDELDFSYRHSAFTENDFILSGEIKLQKGDKAAIKEKMDTLAMKRKSSQPLTMPSAGSTFKRPATGYAAAMIEQSGLKGYSIGGARVSERHAGFVVNTGDASFDDVLRLMDHVKDTVFKKFQVELTPEVKIIR